MNATEPIYITKKGMKELKKQITRLERDRQDVLKSLREIDKQDGRDERLERVDRLAHIELIESELSDKRQVVADAKLLPGKRDTLKVAIGSVVDLIDTSGRLVRYKIVDSIEAHPSDGRISIKSPLGQSLLGKQIQDIVEWGSGLQTNSFRLISIT